jgi:hypothetical protein
MSAEARAWLRVQFARSQHDLVSAYHWLLTTPGASVALERWYDDMEGTESHDPELVEGFESLQVFWRRYRRRQAECAEANGPSPDALAERLCACSLAELERELVRSYALQELCEAAWTRRYGFESTTNEPSKYQVVSAKQFAYGEYAWLY